MVKQFEADEEWVLPQRKPITEAVLDQASATETQAASREHEAQGAWFDRRHGTVIVKLKDGRVFGAEPSFIPSLHAASIKQLGSLRASEDGTFLVVTALDLHISVHGLVTRIMEEVPPAIRHPGARLAGSATTLASAPASPRNRRLGGALKSKVL